MLTNIKRDATGKMLTKPQDTTSVDEYMKVCRCR